MNSLYVWKEEMQKVYARYAKYIDKVLQLILGILVFGMINSRIGYMELAAADYVTAGLAVLFTFLPPVCMAVAAAVLVLLHMFSLSLAVFAVTAAIFLMMFIFYFRFAPGTAMILLMTPLAFLFKIPYVIPVIYGSDRDTGLSCAGGMWNDRLFYAAPCVRFCNRIQRRSRSRGDAAGSDGIYKAGIHK